MNNRLGRVSKLLSQSQKGFLFQSSVHQFLSFPLFDSFYEMLNGQCCIKLGVHLMVAATKVLQYLTASGQRKGSRSWRQRWDDQVRRRRVDDRRLGHSHHSSTRGHRNQVVGPEMVVQNLKDWRHRKRGVKDAWRHINNFTILGLWVVHRDIGIHIEIPR